METITGILKVISKNGGIKLSGSDQWINMAKCMKGFKQEDYDKYRNKQVVVTIESGYWILIEEAAKEAVHKPAMANGARFGMLFNRTHEEALFETSLKNPVDKERFVRIFNKLQELCKSCEEEYHDS